MSTDKELMSFKHNQPYIVRSLYRKQMKKHIWGSNLQEKSDSLDIIKTCLSHSQYNVPTPATACKQCKGW